MLNKRILLMFSLVLIASISFCSSEDWAYNYLDSGEEVSYGGNYSINTNASDFWITDYLGPLNDVSAQFKTMGDQTLYIDSSYIDANWCALTGCTMSGDINMGDNDLNNVDAINMTGTFRQGEDGNMFIYDINNEIHHVNVDLERFDELRANTFTTDLTIETFCNVSGSYINITGEDGRISFIGNYLNEAVSESFDNSNYILPLTEGTNETPILNRVYAYIASGEPTWVVSTTEPTIPHAMASRVLVGDSICTPYATALQEDGDNGFLKRVQRRFRNEGLLYVDGLDYNATLTYLEIGEGGYVNGIYDSEIENPMNTSDGFYLVHNNGSYGWLNSFDDITEYSDGNPIGNNKYFNVIFGVTPYDGQGNIYAVVQSEPATEYTSVIDAYADNDNTLKVYPSEDFLKVFFLPVARMVLNEGNHANILPNGLYAEDYRGGIAGGASSGGGLSEADPIWSADKADYVPYTGATSDVDLGIYSIIAANMIAYSSNPLIKAIMDGTDTTSYAGYGAYNSIAQNIGLSFISYGTDATGTAFNLPKANLSRFYSVGSPLAIGTWNEYNLTLGTNDTAALTIDTNQDVYMVGNVFSDGNITSDYFIGNGSQLTGLPETDLSGYWLSNGSSTATGDWDLGIYNLTTTGTIDGVNTEWDTAYDHSQDNTQAHSDYMLNTGDTSTGDYDFTDGSITTGGNMTVTTVATEVQVNGDFGTGDFTGWSESAGFSVVSGQAQIGPGSTGTLESDTSITIGRTYKVRYDLFFSTGPPFDFTLDVSVGGITVASYGPIDRYTIHSEEFIITAKTTDKLLFTMVDSFSLYTTKIDNVSIEEYSDGGFYTDELSYKFDGIHGDTLILDVNNLVYDGTYGNDLIPSENNIYDIGSSSFAWKDMYLSNLYTTAFISKIDPTTGTLLGNGQITVSAGGVHTLQIADNYVRVNPNAAGVGFYIVSDTSTRGINFVPSDYLQTFKDVDTTITDNYKHYFGTGLDVSQYWNGSDFYINSENVTGNDELRITNFNALVTDGGRRKDTTRVTTTYTILITDDVVFCNTDSAGFTATLPAGVTGQTFRIINTGSSANNLTLAPNGSEHLIGANSNFTLYDGESLILTYGTDGWY